MKIEIMPRLFQCRLMFFGAIVCVIISSSVQALQAAIYAVKPDGTGHYSTIQGCADVARSGDTCLVYPGTYPENVKTKFSGTGESGRIIFKAEGKVTMRGFGISHAYVTVDGFDITGPLNQYGYIQPRVGGDYCQILNNTIRDAENVTGGIYIAKSDGEAANNCTVRGNTFFNLKYTFLAVNGNNHVFENNTLRRLNRRDFIIVGGENHVFRRNIFLEGNEVPNVGNHPDWLQAFGDTTSSIPNVAKNILFEYNWIQNLEGGTQVMQINSGNLRQKVLSPEIHDFTFRYNVFINITGNANVAVPGVTFDHNTFYKSSYGASGIGFGGTLVRGNASRATVTNNVFLSGGTLPNPSDYMGYYANSGASIGAEVLSTKIIPDANDPLNIAIAKDLTANGYTNANGFPTAKAIALTDISQFTLNPLYVQYKADVYSLLMVTVKLHKSIRSTFYADYNFVAGTADAGYPRKRYFGNMDVTGSSEPHGINGGNPLLSNLNNLLGPDGKPFTADDGLRPALGSPLCGKGLGGVDIGAYRCGNISLPPTDDTVAPTVSVSAPLSGDTVSNAVTLRAVAADDVSLAGVQFKLDGKNIGNEDTAPPYTYVWNTTSALNGAHVLTATARDTSNNLTQSAPVTVNVNNNAIPDCSIAQVRCVPSEVPTIQACANVAQAGDTCLVSPGNYPENVRSINAGAEGAYITYRAVYAANDSKTTPSQRSTMKGFRIMDPYIRVEGFDITKYDVGLNMAHITLEPTGDYASIVNNVVRDGIYLTSFDYYFNAANHTITNPAGGFVSAGFVPGVKVYIASNINEQILNHDTIKKVVAVTDTVLTVEDTSDNGVANWQMASEGPVNSTIYVTRTDKSGVSALFFTRSSSEGTADNCTISNNRISNLAGHAISLGGSNTLFENNTIEDMHGWSFFRLSGNNNIIRRNVFQNSPRWPGFPPVNFDVVHSPGTGTWDLYSSWLYSSSSNQISVNNTLIEFNLFKDIDNSLGQVEYLGSTAYGVGMTFRNNIVVGVESMGAFHFPKTAFINNTFVNSALKSGHNFVLGNNVHGNPKDSLVKNNVFVGTGFLSDPNGDYGWYSLHDVVLAEPANWNFVAGPASLGYPAKKGFSGTETHGINGGDPQFQNISNLLGPDGIPFTVDDGLKPTANSPLCASGEEGRDRGAYSCSANEVFSDSDTTEPETINQAPRVDAGQDQSIMLPAVAVLSAVISDNSGSDLLTVLWKQISGPAPVTFLDSAAAKTEARFLVAGSYELEISATDGELTGSDRIKIIVSGFPSTTDSISGENESQSQVFYPEKETLKIGQYLKSEPGTIDIYDRAGSLVRSFPDATRSTQWDGRNQKGNPVSVGVYLLKMSHGSKKIVVVK